MRRVLAAGLAAFLVFVAAAPHVHTGPHGAEDCAACAARHAEQAHSEVPDLAPIAIFEVAVPLAPWQVPSTGAPLGAIPGQSPPESA